MSSLEHRQPTPPERQTLNSNFLLFFVTEMTSISVQGKHLDRKEMKDRKKEGERKYLLRGKVKKFTHAHCFSEGHTD